MEREQAIKLMRDLMTLMIEKGGSDLFITVGFPPAMKLKGTMKPISKTPLTAENTKAMCYAVMNDKRSDREMPSVFRDRVLQSRFLHDRPGWRGRRQGGQ